MRKIMYPILLLALALTACGDDDGVIRVDDSDAGTQIAIGSTDRLEVNLEGNPTTGYDWEVERPGVMRLVDRSHAPDSDAIGSGGLSTLIFEPTMIGSGDLVLIYHRSWEEGEEPLETFSITVSVVD